MSYLESFIKKGKLPNGYWNDENNHIQYFEYLKKELKIEKEDDWYNLTQDDIKNNYGQTFLSQINRKI
jgi:AMMECR1 domain-containing protein